MLGVRDVSLVEDVKSLRAWEITAALAFFLATIAPGFLLIHHYSPALLRELETAKLVVFAASLTLPLLGINALLLVLMGSFLQIWGHGANRSEVFFWLAVWTIAVFYGALFIAYLCSLPPAQFVAVVAGLDVVVAVAVFFIIRFFKAENPQPGAPGDGPRPAGSARS